MLKSRILRNHNGAKDRGGQTSQRTRSVWRCRVAGAQKKWRQNRAHWIWPEGAQCQFQGVQGISREHEVRMTLFWETFLWMEGKGTTPDDLGWFCCYQFVFSFRWERPKLLKIAWISSGANTQKNRKEEGAANPDRVKLLYVRPSSNSGCSVCAPEHVCLSKKVGSDCGAPSALPEWPLTYVL